MTPTAGKSTKPSEINVRTTNFNGTHGRHPLGTAVSKLVRSGAVLEGKSVREVLMAAQASQEDIDAVEAEGIGVLVLRGQPPG